MAPPLVPISGTRPQHTYTPWKLPEWKKFQGLLEKSLAKTPVTRTDHIWKELLDRPISREVSSLEEAEQYMSSLPLVNQDTVVETRDGTRLMVFFRKGLFRPWKPELAQEVIEGTMEAIIRLGNVYKPKAPKEQSNKRYVGYTSQQKRWIHDGKVFGVYHFALWKQMGHSAMTPTLSSETIGNTEKFNHVDQFFRKIAPLIQTIGLLFRGVDIEVYTSYLINYNDWLDETPLRILQMSNRACFAGLALLRNTQVGPHKDSGDIKDGWVAMCAWGEFEGGEMILPELQMQLRFQQGGVIFLRSALFEHFIAPFTGERAATIFFTKKNVHR